MPFINLFWDKRYKVSKTGFPDCVFCGNSSHLGSFVKTTSTYDPDTNTGMPRPLQNTNFINRDDRYSINFLRDVMKSHSANCSKEGCKHDCPLEAMFREAEDLVNRPLSEIRREGSHNNRIINSLDYARKNLDHPAVFKRSPTPFFQTERIDVNSTDCPGCGLPVHPDDKSTRINKVYQAGTPVLEGYRTNFRTLKDLGILSEEEAKDRDQFIDATGSTPEDYGNRGYLFLDVPGKSKIPGLSKEEYAKFEERYKQIQIKAQENWGTIPHPDVIASTPEVGAESRHGEVRTTSVVRQPLHTKCFRAMVLHCPALKNTLKIDPTCFEEGTGGGSKFKGKE